MRRVLFYLFFDPQGRVDEFVTHKLEQLRPYAEHIFVVSNTPLDTENRERLEGVADTVWVRENVGFDVWAYKEALHVFGADRLQDFDELVLMNYTFFGPIGSFGPMFEQVESRPDVDFWGITEHGSVKPHPFMDADELRTHIQSHWIGVRARMFTSATWSQYWAQMPMISSYFDSVNRHESIFTQHFVDAGFRPLVLYPEAEYPSIHPVMDNAAMMLRDGCPIVKRRLFFHDPMYLESHGIDGREITRLIEASGYPMDLIYANLARTTTPRWLVTNLGLLDVLPDVDLGYERDRPLRVVALVHIYYPEMTDELVDRLDTLPTGYDLVVTTTDERRKAAIHSALARRGTTADIRVVESNRGRDISAFFIACRDILESDDYDLVVKIHSKKSPQDTGNLGQLFKRHLLENLLSSPGYSANVLRLFQQHPSLGMVFPPVIHVGYPTLGHAWFKNKEPAKVEAERLGIHVPLDESTPVATYGSMFIARPAALRRIAAAGYAYEDFPDEGGYTDGALSHVLERLISYACLEEGLHVREVMNAENMAISFSYLEFKQQLLAAQLPGYPAQQLRTVIRLKRRRARAVGKRRKASPRDRLAAAKAGLAERTPATARVLRRPYRMARDLYRSRPGSAPSTRR